MVTRTQFVLRVFRQKLKFIVFLITDSCTASSSRPTPPPATTASGSRPVADTWANSSVNISLDNLKITANRKTPQPSMHQLQQHSPPPFSGGCQL
ncbi:hypothetical protein FHG87_015295 [Trinorchestia longiramus]|nr:hypothetical protein FHG87_015295 [Trinorchestia longiramus]